MRHIIISIFFLLLFYYIGYTSGGKEIEKQPILKECECLTYSQYALWSEKYNRFVSENKPDSVAKYAELLNQIK